LAKGVDVNIKDDNGFTALHWATQTCNMDSIVKLLGITGIDVNCSDFIGWTPLHYAWYNTLLLA
jgi:ankyrin repeat protein